MSRFTLALLAILIPASSARAALVLDAPDGIRQGYQATFRITGATPGGQVVLLKGDPGPGACPPQLGGLCLGITDHVVLGTRRADANGVAVFTPTVPMSIPWGPLSLQAAQGGTTPAVSNVDTTAVLWEAVGAVDVVDEASLDAARYLWRAEGAISLADGPYGDVVDLPYLQELCGLQMFQVRGRQVTAPAATAVKDIGVSYVTTPASVDMPAATGAPAGCAGPGSALVFAEHNAADVSISLPSYTSTAYVVIAGVDSADLQLSLPALQTAADVVLRGSAGGGTLTVDLGGLVSAASVNLSDMDVNLPLLRTVANGLHLDGSGMTSVNLPSLETVGVDVQIASTSATGFPSFGVPGLSLGGLIVSGNPLLTDISGLQDAVVADYLQVAYNPVLPSCAAAALSPTYCRYNLLDACSDDPFDVCYPGTP